MNPLCLSCDPESSFVSNEPSLASPDLRSDSNRRRAWTGRIDFCSEKADCEDDRRPPDRSNLRTCKTKKKIRIMNRR